MNVRASLFQIACGASLSLLGACAASGSQNPGSGVGNAGNSANGGDPGSAGNSVGGGQSGDTTASGGSSFTGAGGDATGGSSGAVGTGGNTVTSGGAGGSTPGSGGTGMVGTGGAAVVVGAPPGFWDASNIPPAKNTLMFKFLNRTNGKYPDSQVYWSFKDPTTGAAIEHSIAEAPTYDMPAKASGRMYFSIGPSATSQYKDFIEFTIGPTSFNGNTSRVDAFVLKVAMLLHSAAGADVPVGDEYAMFTEDRAVTFQKFMNEVPAEFQACVKSPLLKISQPGGVGFGAGGPNQDYYTAFAAKIWAANGITVPAPGPNGSGLGCCPNLSAAIYRHVGDKAGTFTPAGALMDKTLWSNSATFYTAAPADYYANFWHKHGINGKAYGFPYDDVGGYSTYVSRQNPQYLLIAIGF